MMRHLIAARVNAIENANTEISTLLQAKAFPLEPKKAQATLKLIQAALKQALLHSEDLGDELVNIRDRLMVLPVSVISV